jgi:hypothetical protein
MQANNGTHDEGQQEVPELGPDDGFIQFRAKTHNQCGISADKSLVVDFGRLHPKPKPRAHTMQANNVTHDEGQQEVDAHTMKANTMLTRCKNTENQQEFDAVDESDTMKAINQFYKPPPNWTEAHVIIHPFRGGPPMNVTMSKQEFKEAWAKDKLTEAVAKQSCKDAWANEAKAQASWAKAHGKVADYANGYWSIAQIRCDERKKRIMKVHSNNSPPQSSKEHFPRVLQCKPPWSYCTRAPSIAFEI